MSLYKIYLLIQWSYELVEPLYLEFCEMAERYRPVIMTQEHYLSMQQKQHQLTEECKAMKKNRQLIRQKCQLIDQRLQLMDRKCQVIIEKLISSDQQKYQSQPYKINHKSTGANPMTLTKRKKTRFFMHPSQIKQAESKSSESTESTESTDDDNYSCKF